MNVEILAVILLTIVSIGI